jgi:hypothetical protein
MTRSAARMVLTSALLFSTTLPALSAANCSPENFKTAIDAFANEPFGARAWRQLNGLGDPAISAESYADNDWKAREDWQKLVSEITPDNPQLADPAYDCRIAYPLQVLNERITKFGKTSTYVKQWLLGQGRVLAACANVTVPADAAPLAAGALKPDEEALMSFDVAYQRASVAFYANKAEAVGLFKAISASASPHKAAARYNIANLMANGKDLAGARTEAKSILADPALAAMHEPTRALLGYISNLEDTPEGWSELIDNTVDLLSKPTTDIVKSPTIETAYAKALYDIEFAGVTKKQDDWWVTNTLPKDATLSKALADSARKHPMVTWMMAGQTINAPSNLAPWSVVGPKWDSWSTSFVDRSLALVPASQALQPLPKMLLESLKPANSDAERMALWSTAQHAADKTHADCSAAPDAAAVTFLALQAVRASARVGRFDEIYALLPKLRLEGTQSLRDVILPKLMQHLLASGNSGEGRILRDTLITPELLGSFKSPDDDAQRDLYGAFLIYVAEDQSHWLQGTAMQIEKLGNTALNLQPAKDLRELAQSQIFSAEQKAVLTRAAWTRNYARGIANSEKTTQDMLAANPEISAAFEAVKKEFPTLKTERAVLLTILRNPRFGILVNSPDWSDPIEAKRDSFAALDQFDANDKNWWCPIETDRQLLALRAEYDEASGLSMSKNYGAATLKQVLADDAIAKAEIARDTALRQNPMIKSINWKEITALANAPSAPKLLTQRALAWAKAPKADAAAAEALARAVEATRYGCRWHGSHEAYSKPAQELLKVKFPTSQWVAKTPYWFGCMDSQYDAQFNKVTTCKVRTWPKQLPLK